ncbi:hypothetical protein ACFO9Q_04160 [Paenibacillus sp. GCM10023252]|uniref:hypothetical protein n=1 Tax=Paenibacillus sp. GCM10023252 TaxID=3252649 RepID=UPI00361856B3
MPRSVRILFTSILILILLLGGACWGLLRYAAPEEELTLSYEPIDLQSKALAMARKLKPELILTEEDMNNLVKSSLAQAPLLSPDFTLQGARVELEGDRLIVHLNVTYRDRIPVGAVAEYRMSWEEPNVRLQPVSLKVKGIQLPEDRLEPILVPLDLRELKVIQVREVIFDGDRIRLLFRANLQL